ncbi:hypothetical protein DXG03_001790, partial [Asterophora parasitica]
GTIFAATGPVPLTNASASVTFSTTNFTLPPGLSLPVVAQFTLPEGDASTFPVYSGFIEVSSGPTDNLHVTYLGLGASLKDKQVLDTTDKWLGIRFPLVLNSTLNIQVNPTNYTFKGQDAPILLYRLVFGTPYFRLDLVDFNIQLADIPNEGDSFSNVPIVGPLADFDYIPRHDNSQSTGASVVRLSTHFANGTSIPNGSYRLLIRALRVTGDATKEEDYDSWLSPIIGFQT